MFKGMDPWKFPHMHEVLLPPVLREFAKGLKQALWSWMMMGAGFGVYGSHLLLKERLPASQTLLMLAAFAMIGGAILHTWSKMKCYEFAAPVSGRWAITAAFWFDVAAIALRFGGRHLHLGGSLVRLLAGMCALVSLVCFLVFLARLSNLVARSDCRNYAWLVIGATAAAIISPIVWTAIVFGKIGGGPALTGVYVTVGMFAIPAFLFYGWLLRNLSAALMRTADFMERNNGADEFSDEVDLEGAE
jgi:hypothetical protein